ncbi:ABC transporter ATP-binding protein [Advenella kashmirensis]
MADVVVENLGRQFGSTMALDDISFEVRSGEFVTLLGPSGCGKSTTLGALAGLDRPTSGRISIGGQCVFDGARNIFVDARYRKLGLMFQTYALWPHMTVYGNLDFALELNGVRGKEARSRIDEVLAMVDMEKFALRFPGELSGGQQQRVALARTMVYRPTILLLDEPLSNLDASLREKARLWLADIQRRTGMTTVFVTHDQTEALSLSDRIIVMNGGRIAQIGTPTEVYQNPATAFVAEFVGASNLFVGTVQAPDQRGARVKLENGPVLSLSHNDALQIGAQVTLSARPENLQMSARQETDTYPADIVSRSYMGSRILVEVRLGTQTLRVEVPATGAPVEGFLRIPQDSLRVFV